jgi:ammonia channel protein AmtB
VKRIAGLRVDEDAETHGLDISVHDERGYALVD